MSNCFGNTPDYNNWRFSTHSSEAQAALSKFVNRLKYSVKYTTAGELAIYPDRMMDSTICYIVIVLFHDGYLLLEERVDFNKEVHESECHFPNYLIKPRLEYLNNWKKQLQETIDKGK